MKICECCLQEIESRGEKIAVMEHGYVDVDNVCDWCNEDMAEDEDCYEIEFI